MHVSDFVRGLVAFIVAQNYQLHDKSLTRTAIIKLVFLAKYYASKSGVDFPSLRFYKCFYCSYPNFI